MGMRLFSAPAEPGGMEAPPLPPELTRALDLPSDTSVIDAVDAIDHDAVASTLRKGMRLVEEMTELATEAAAARRWWSSAFGRSPVGGA